MGDVRLLDDGSVQAILGAFPVPFVVYEASTGRIAEANGAAGDLLGSAALVGAHIGDLVADVDEAGRAADGFPSSAITPGTFHTADGRAVRRADGRLVHVDCVVADAVVAGTRYRLLAMRDVSARVAEERARGRAAHDLIHHQVLFRREVAERLHDGPVQVLTAASLRLGLLRASAPGELADEVAEIERLVSQSLRDVREEMEDLRPPIDAPDDLGATLEDLLLRLAAADRYVVTCGPDTPPVSTAQLLVKVVEHLVTTDAVDTGRATATMASAPLDPPGVIDVHVRDGECALRMRLRGDGDLTERLRSWAMTLHGTIARTTDSTGTTIVLTVPAPR